MQDYSTDMKLKHISNEKVARNVILDSDRLDTRQQQHSLTLRESNLEDERHLLKKIELNNLASSHTRDIELSMRTQIEKKRAAEHLRIVELERLRMGQR